MVCFPVVQKRFRFFEEAKWMAAEKAKENYQMTPSGAISVGKPGIYIIHANVSMIVLRNTPINDDNEYVRSMALCETLSHTLLFSLIIFDIIAKEQNLSLLARNL